ncbi:MAG: hypothetical protein FJY65_01140 [Calditrichaeota bacterium]|nr:hypothetical protein [Calditrichota bacterium]
MDTLWTWVAAALTLMILSFLYKDNPAYKIAEHLFIGVAAGYGLAVEYFNVFKPNLQDPLLAGRDWWLLFPLALGLLMFTRFTEKWSWISRWPLAYMVGIYSGMAVIGFTEGDLMRQIEASLIPPISTPAVKAFIAAPGFLPLLNALASPIIVFGLICILLYFFFSLEHKGTAGAFAKVGTGLLMVGFGAGYGYTVMTRFALLIDRFYFLMSDWLKVI